MIPGIAPTTFNYQITDPTRQLVYNYTGRIDQHIGTKDFIFFRYAGIQWYQTAPSTLPTLFTSTQIPAQQYGVSWMHVFNPTTSMQVQYGRTHVEDDTLTQFNDHNLWTDLWMLRGHVQLLRWRSRCAGDANGNRRFQRR